MAWDVAVAGTVHLDDISTPAGHRTDQLGGSAVYFALSAARRATVHLNGIVGADTAPLFKELLESAGVRHEGLVVSDAPTFRWHARHDFERWVAVDTSSEEGCDPLWQAVLSEPAAQAQVLFLASMRPSLQGAVLAQSRARLIGADSMTEYTGTQRVAVRELVHACDVLFLNQSELASLTDTPITSWRQEAIALCGVGRLRAVVVKGGPKGASLVTTDGIVTLPPARVDTVVDPTGAGDALAGGFLAACASAERDDVEYFAAALEEGLRCAAAAIGVFGLAGLTRAA